MTIAETITSVGIMTIVLLIVTQIFISNFDIVQKQSSRIDNDIGAVFGIRRVSDAARGATAVVASQTVNGTAYVSGADTLILKLPSLDASFNVIEGSFDHVAFARDPLAPTTIFSDTEPAVGSARTGGKRSMTTHNQTMIFRYNASDITEADRISVFLVNSQTVKGATFTTRSWTSLFLRNAP